MEKQVLFFLRNCLEAKGYRFVPLDQSPDFLATITVSSEYKESYVPPSTDVLPVWVPDRTITSYSSYSSHGWGSYSGSSTTTTYVPGYLTMQTYTRPGYTVSHHYPSASVAIFDAKTLKNVWLGTGVGTSDNPDARVSSQVVVGHILVKFPNSVVRSESPSPGSIGIKVSVFTIDGNNYVPTVVSVASGSPAARAGIEPEDMILTIDGLNVVNKPISEVMQLLRGDPGTHVTLQLWRVGQQITVNVTRAQRDKVKR